MIRVFRLDCCSSRSCPDCEGRGYTVEVTRGRYVHGGTPVPVLAKVPKPKVKVFFVEAKPKSPKPPQQRTKRPVATVVLSEEQRDALRKALKGVHFLRLESIFEVSISSLHKATQGLRIATSTADKIVAGLAQIAAERPKEEASRRLPARYQLILRYLLGTRAMPKAEALFGLPWAKLEYAKNGVRVPGNEVKQIVAVIDRWRQEKDPTGIVVKYVEMEIK